MVAKKAFDERRYSYCRNINAATYVSRRSIAARANRLREGGQGCCEKTPDQDDAQPSRAQQYFSSERHRDADSGSQPSQASRSDARRRRAGDSGQGRFPPPRGDDEKDLVRAEDEEGWPEPDRPRRTLCRGPETRERRRGGGSRELRRRRGEPGKGQGQEAPLREQVRFRLPPPRPPFPFGPLLTRSFAFPRARKGARSRRESFARPTSSASARSPSSATRTGSKSTVTRRTSRTSSTPTRGTSAPLAPTSTSRP